MAYRKLIELTDDEDGGVRLYSTMALARMGRTEAGPRIGELLGNDEDWGVRAAAALALGTIGAEGSTEALLAAHENDDVADVRRNCAVALARYGDASGRPTLEKMLLMDAPQMRIQARQALELLKQTSPPR